MDSELGSGRLLSVNVARMRLIQAGGQTMKTGIYKDPVRGRVPVRDNRVGADRQANPAVHGGRDKAAYSYAAEDYEWWAAELGIETAPGLFGENLTVSGIDVSGAVVGERWRVGSTLLEVSEPRQPCSKLGYKLGDQRFVKRFATAHRPGAYLRVIEEGELGVGDAVEVVERPGHGVSIELISRIALGEREQLPRLLEVAALSAGWREWARAKLAGPEPLSGAGGGGRD